MRTAKAGIQTARGDYSLRGGEWRCGERRTHELWSTAIVSCTLERRLAYSIAVVRIADVKR